MCSSGTPTNKTGASVGIQPHWSRCLLALNPWPVRLDYCWWKEISWYEECPNCHVSCISSMGSGHFLNENIDCCTLVVTTRLKQKNMFHGKSETVNRVNILIQRPPIDKIDEQWSKPIFPCSVATQAQKTETCARIKCQNGRSKDHRKFSQIPGYISRW